VLQGCHTYHPSLQTEMTMARTGTALEIENELGSDVAPCHVITSNLFVCTYRHIFHSYPHMHAWKLIFISDLISVHFINTEYFFNIIIFLAYFPYLRETKKRLRRSSCCLYVHIFFISCAVLVVLKESRQFFLPRTSCC
jgi:hypothetical protein